MFAVSWGRSGGPALQPPLRIDLSPDQRAELDRRLRARTTERREYERLRMVRAVADGLTVPAAARALGCHHQTVRQAVKRFRAEGFAGLADRPRAGRPPTVAAADLDALAARLDEDAATGARTWTLGQAAGWLAEARGVAVTPGHLGELLARRDFRWKRTKRATGHKQGDRLRQAQAAADLALWRFGGS
jgi:putative transposase